MKEENKKKRFLTCEMGLIKLKCSNKTNKKKKGDQKINKKNITVSSNLGFFVSKIQGKRCNLYTNVKTTLVEVIFMYYR